MSLFVRLVPCSFLPCSPPGLENNSRTLAWTGRILGVLGSCGPATLHHYASLLPPLHESLTPIVPSSIVIGVRLRVPGPPTETPLLKKLYESDMRCHTTYSQREVGLVSELYRFMVDRRRAPQNQFSVRGIAREGTKCRENHLAPVKRKRRRKRKEPKKGIREEKRKKQERLAVSLVYFLGRTCKAHNGQTRQREGAKREARTGYSRRHLYPSPNTHKTHTDSLLTY